MPTTPTATYPLAGQRILVGRARHQSGTLANGLKLLGAQVISIPFIEIRKPKSFAPLDRALKNLKSYDWLILTSANGVEAMFDRLRKLRLTRRDVTHLHVAAIGPATKKAIEKRKLKVELVPDEYVAESVVKKMKAKVKGKRVLLVRAKVARDVIPVELRKAGAQVDVVEAYETVLPRNSKAKLRALVNGDKRPHVVTFTSSSTVRNFVQLLGAGNKKKLAGIKMASIGPVTSSTLRELKLPVDIEAREFTMGGLIRSIVIDTYAEKL
jgi:uroporphyrinogen-III synthase